MNTAPLSTRRSAALAVALLAVLLHLPTLRYGFVFDDMTMLTTNPEVAHGITPASLRWALTTTHSGHWHPLTWLSHLTDIELFGMKPAGHHATSVLFHAANAVLVFLLLEAMTGRRARSWVVAALFAVHPLHVESAAWVADRKDLLAAFWAFVALGAWLRWGRRGSRAAYGASLVAFALAVLSKSMAATLPALLLLVDAWPLGRWRAGRSGWPRLLLEKIPFVVPVVLSMAMGARAAGDAKGEGLMPSPWPWAIQSANALTSYATYIVKTVWPHRLAVFYPYETHPEPVRVVVSALVLAALVVAAWRLRRRVPGFAWGMAWFLVSLLPVIGLVPGGPLAMADRYMYLPIVGLLVPAVWGGAEAMGTETKRWSRPMRASSSLSSPAAARMVPAVLTSLAITALAAVSVVQSRTWRDNPALYAHAFEVNPSNPITWHNMAVLAAERGDIERAIELYREALRIDPRFVGGHHNLGVHLARLGRLDEAIAEYHAALAVNPGSTQTRYDLAGALARSGRGDEAIREYREALRIDPGFAAAHNNLGAMLMKRGDVDAAIAEYEEALRLSPASAIAQRNLEEAVAYRSSRAPADTTAGRDQPGAVRGGRSP